jgi:hypothetical protein
MINDDGKNGALGVRIIKNVEEERKKNQKKKRQTEEEEEEEERTKKKEKRNASSNAHDGYGGRRFRERRRRRRSGRASERIVRSIVVFSSVRGGAYERRVLRVRVQLEERVVSVVYPPSQSS